jgi:ADP-ribose pyrophosphatase YjhB (NUDIX family)
VNQDKLLFPLVAVDVAVFILDENHEKSTTLQTLLVKRAQAPAQGQWSLPGGLLKPDVDKSLEDTARRVLKEKINVDVEHLKQVCVISGDDRDPRGWSLSVLYCALVASDEFTPSACSSVTDLKWVSAALPGNHLAFDHAKLLRRALVQLRKATAEFDLPLGLMPQAFTLPALQKTCEAILGRTLDKAMFRKRIDDLVVPLENQFDTSSSKRPAQRYSKTQSLHRLVTNDQELLFPPEYLQAMAQPVPPWLAKYRSGHAFDLKQFFGHRVVYYPGSRLDGYPVEVFGSTHCAHTFVYVDYGLTQSDIEAALNDETQGFKGYICLDRIQLSQADLSPKQWVPLIQMREVNYQHVNPQLRNQPFGFVQILERRPGLGDEHGPVRLAILFLGADGFAAYDAIYSQREAAPPFALVLEDRSHSKNYSTFGSGGLLERIATTRQKLPSYFLVSKDTAAWEGSRRVTSYWPIKFAAGETTWALYASDEPDLGGEYARL